jgi:hypothetical protein
LLAATLADDGEIGFAEGIMADQVFLGIGHAIRLSRSVLDRIERSGCILCFFKRRFLISGAVPLLRHATSKRYCSRKCS